MLWLKYCIYVIFSCFFAYISAFSRVSRLYIWSLKHMRVWVIISHMLHDCFLSVFTWAKNSSWDIADSGAHGFYFNSYKSSTWRPTLTPNPLEMFIYFEHRKHKGSSKLVSWMKPKFRTSFLLEARRIWRWAMPRRRALTLLSDLIGFK